MEMNELVQTARDLAEYFVYCCGEGEHYVSLVEGLRTANTRSTLLKAVYLLLRYGDQHLKQEMESMNQKRMDKLFQFFQMGEIGKVSWFRSTLISSIATFELENIHRQELYLVELLSY